MSNQIIPPTKCPSCNSNLEWSNHLLYCYNNSCPAKSSKKIEHFAKTMKIKGLGPSSIDKLQVTHINQIYELSEERIEYFLGSEKLAAKLYKEICNSVKAPLNSVLPALGIPLIGKTASSKLAATCDSIYDVNESTCLEAGIGPKATDNLLTWIELEFPLLTLPFDWKFNKPKKKDKGVVCISGKTKTFKTKGEATKALESAGYEVKSSVTKEVSILVNESGIESSKTKKARESGITIVTNLNDLIGE